MTTYEVHVKRPGGAWELLPRRQGVDLSDPQAAEKEAVAALCSRNYEATRRVPVRSNTA